MPALANPGPARAHPASPRMTASGARFGGRPSAGPAGFGVSADGNGLPDLDSEALVLGGVRDRIGMWRALLDRPLTSYYLVLGLTTLLLGLGLVMVQSTASVADLIRSECGTGSACGVPCLTGR